MPKPTASSSVHVVEYHRGHPVSLFSIERDVNGGATPRQTTPQPHGVASVAANVTSVLRAAFLPEGFPDSVSSDYLGFQAWDTVQALSSYVRGMLTSAAILRGVGVGQQASSPLAAVFTFFLRDLAGMLGGILFAYLQGSGFDSCAKQWRLFADITNDVGMTLELASPLLPRACFLPIACAGSIARSVTGVAGGATRAALTQHFAVRGNAADVAAKEQSQETATTIVGMVLGMALTRLLTPYLHTHTPDLPDADTATTTATNIPLAVIAAWLVFGALTAVHVAANLAALRCLLLTSLNQPRAEMLVTRYLRDGAVLSPRQVAQTEDLTPPPFRRLLDSLSGAARRQSVRLHWGSRLGALLPHPEPGHGTSKVTRTPPSSLEQLLAHQGHRRYLLVVAAPSLTPTTSHSSPATAKPAAATSSAAAAAAPAAQAQAHVHVVLSASAGPSDQLRAFTHAHLLGSKLESLLAVARQLQHGGQGRQGRLGGSGSAEREAHVTEAVEAAEAEAEEWVAARYDGMVAELAAAGWRPERVTLPRPAWTAEWGPEAQAAVAAAGGRRRQGGVHED